MDERSIPCYFLGANAPTGFCSRFDAMYDPQSDWRCVILKGGPGSGKSTLLRRFAERARAQGKQLELIYCSSDPRSLDAVILPEEHRCMADGTAPHTLEPKLPGACEMLFNPGDYWDAEKLFEQRAEIRALNAEIAAHHRRASGICAVVGVLLTEARRLAAEALDTERLDRYLTRLSKRMFRGLPRAEGSEEVRFLSGITPSGWITFAHTLPCCARRIALIDDDTGAAAPAMLARIRREALARGCRVISCASPLRPDALDAVILPDRGEAFAVSGGLLHYPFTPERTIHVRRFFNAERLSACRGEIRFRRKTALALLEDVYDELAQALALHDRLEQHYMAAMDFAALDEAADALLQNFLPD